MKFKLVNGSMMWTAQNPNAALGDHGNARTIEITNVPETQNMADVCHTLNQTLLWAGCKITEPRFSFDFSELGDGRVIAQ